MIERLDPRFRWIVVTCVWFGVYALYQSALAYVPSKWFAPSLVFSFVLGTVLNRLFPQRGRSAIIMFRSIVITFVAVGIGYLYCKSILTGRVVDWFTVGHVILFASAILQVAWYLIFSPHEVLT